MDIQLPSILETLGLGVFLYYLINGLRQKIQALSETLQIQSKTLEVMEKRIVETEKVGDLYKNLLSDLPSDLDNYKAIVSKTKDETILELQNQKALMESKLAKAEEKVEGSDPRPDVARALLKVLKNLLSIPEDVGDSSKREYELAKLCEFDGRTFEKCVPLLFESETVDEFLDKLHYKVTVMNNMDPDITNNIIQNRTLPNGVMVTAAYMTSSTNGGWHTVANENIYTNKIRLDELRNEFKLIKAIE